MQWLFLIAATTAPEPIDLNWQFRTGRAPIIEVSRESAEPPLLAPTVKQSLTVRKTCFCSPACVCGCNDGRPCQCKQVVANSTTTSTYPGSPNNSNQGATPYIPAGHTHPAILRVFAPVPNFAVPSMPVLGRVPSVAAPARNC
jgi:hypothetical protein